MTLKNIQLPESILAELYKLSIVDLPDSGKIGINQTADVLYLGGNNKNILLLINNAEAEYLTDSELIFLSGVLTACNLSIEDIAVVNLKNVDASKYKLLPDVLKAEIIILSGIELSTLELPFKIPLFQLQAHKDKRYVCIPSLKEIQNDTGLKTGLWKLLKILFSV